MRCLNVFKYFIEHVLTHVSSVLIESLIAISFEIFAFASSHYLIRAVDYGMKYRVITQFINITFRNKNFYKYKSDSNVKEFWNELYQKMYNN